MAAATTKIRARPKDGAIEVMVLVSHPMETGLRVDAKTKEKIPAHFIQKMTFELNNKVVAVADLGTGISKDPLITVLVNAKPGDKVKAVWTDNKGESGGAETIVGRETSG
jgi:sulfur-oxidizing protein SoxZ